MPALDAMLLTTVRLFGEAIEHCLGSFDAVSLRRIASSLVELRQALNEVHVNVVLVDVTQSIAFHEVGELAREHPDIAFIALGLQDQASHIIHAGQCGFAGYVARDATIATLVGAITDAAAGRLSCPGEVAGHLLRALFQHSPPPPLQRWASSTDGSLDGLTRRERDVARLVGLGHSNKEIARKLCLSLATVKHHVHHVLEKLQLDRRAQVSALLGPSATVSLRPRHDDPIYAPRAETGP